MERCIEGASQRLHSPPPPPLATPPSKSPAGDGAAQRGQDVVVGGGGGGGGGREGEGSGDGGGGLPYCLRRGPRSSGDRGGEAPCTEAGFSTGACRVVPGCRERGGEGGRLVGGGGGIQGRTPTTRP